MRFGNPIIAPIQTSRTQFTVYKNAALPQGLTVIPVSAFALPPGISAKNIKGLTFHYSLSAAMDTDIPTSNIQLYLTPDSTTALINEYFQTFFSNVRDFAAPFNIADGPNPAIVLFNNVSSGGVHNVTMNIVIVADTDASIPIMFYGGTLGAGNELAMPTTLLVNDAENNANSPLYLFFQNAALAAGPPAGLAIGGLDHATERKLIPPLIDAAGDNGIFVVGGNAVGHAPVNSYNGGALGLGIGGLDGGGLFRYLTTDATGKLIISATGGNLAQETGGNLASIQAILAAITAANAAGVPADAIMLGVNGAGLLQRLRGLADNTDAVAVDATAEALAAIVRETVFNGATWDRRYSNHQFVGIASTSSTATSALFNSFNAQIITVTVHVSAVSGGSVTVGIRARTASGFTPTIASVTAGTASNFIVVANSSVGVPARFDIQATVTGTITYAVDVDLS